MSPVWIIEGAAPRDPEAERALAAHRLEALTAAIREHEQGLRRDASDLRPQDQHLYGRAREICDEP
jgi:hypothetical protein